MRQEKVKIYQEKIKIKMNGLSRYEDKVQEYDLSGNQ